MKNQDLKTIKMTKSTQNRFHMMSKLSLPGSSHLLTLTTVLIMLFSLGMGAQTWSDQGNGTYLDRFTINDDNSNHWSQLRLQVSNNNGWNMINEGYLWWGHSNSGDHSNKGTEKMRLTQNGDLGIGITHPDAKLDVSGDIRVHNMFNIKSIGHLNLQADHDNSGDGNIYFKANNDVRMIMLDNGNFGIGTISPSAKLEVNGNIKVGHDRYLKSVGVLNFQADDDNSGDGVFHFKSGPDIQMIIQDNGNVGIGTNSPTHKLEVLGTIKTTSLISSARSFPDYVFAEDYNIQPLSELETYVKTYRHLPNMPAESEVVKNGLDVPEILTKSVENIETIYLHLIKMEKEITSLKKDNARLKAQIATKH